MKRVLIIDDHEVVREALAELLREEGFEVVGTEGEIAAGVERAVELQPDVVVLDVNEPGANGVEAVRRVRELVAGVRVVVLSLYEEPWLREALLGAGAAAFVGKNGPVERLVGAIGGG